MASRYDAIIIGAGHNGLVCGSYLAKAGLKVLAVEARPIIGGACVTEEPWPGFKVSTCSYVMSLMQPKIILDLELKKHGLEVLPLPPGFMPMPGNRSIVFWPEEERLVAEIARFSERDAAAYPLYRRQLERLTPFVREIIWETPPNVASRRVSDLIKTAKLLFKYKKHAHLFYEIYDLLTMSAYDYLTKWFESDEVITALGYYVQGGGTNASMKAPATAFSCIRPLVRDHSTPAGPWGFVRGGMGTISKAIASFGTAHGLEVRTSARVKRIDTEGGRAVGVTLDSGEELRARAVISNANAKTTFLKLAANLPLPDDFTRNVRNIRTRSTLFKVHLGVRELPRYTDFSHNERGYPYPASVRLAPSVAYLENAFDDAKRGRIASHPILAIMAPSVCDDTVAPKGMHLLSILGGHVPYRLEGRDWDEAARQEVLEATLRTIETFAPGFRQHVVHTELLTPVDLEQRFDLTDGHVHHGDLTIDQAFVRRPVGGYADYRTPIPALYLCGASTHPGGGVTGVPGHNAAREILKDLRRRAA